MNRSSKESNFYVTDKNVQKHDIDLGFSHQYTCQCFTNLVNSSISVIIIIKVNLQG